MGHFPGFCWSMKKKDAGLTVCYVLAGESGASFPCAVFQCGRNKLLQMHWEIKYWSLRTQKSCSVCMVCPEGNDGTVETLVWQRAAHIVKDCVTLDVYYASRHVGNMTHEALMLAICFLFSILMFACSCASVVKGPRIHFFCMLSNVLCKPVTDCLR